MMAGGHTAPRTPDCGETKFLTSEPIRKLIEEEMKKIHGGNDDLKVMDPILMTTQVVAGTNYKVKYHVGNNKYVHAKIFEPLPCYKDEQQLQVYDFEMEKSKNDPL